MSAIIFNLFSCEALVKKIASGIVAEVGDVTIRNFPDAETYLKINSFVKNREVILLTSLDYPNEKILPLLFAAKNLKDMGAKRVGLIAPYLAYMRQDKVFNIGEAIGAKYFAELLSNYFDWLITIDPHLHRISDLNGIFSIPTKVLSSGKIIAGWIKNQVKHPVIIVPDTEGDQWIADIAKTIDAPFVVVKKIRKGDVEVELSIPDLKNYKNRTPVIVDDIISTGVTMIETVKRIKELNMIAPICIGIHAVFAGNAYKNLLGVGVNKILTCNTISHVSNEIDLSGLIIDFLNDGFL